MHVLNINEHFRQEIARVLAYSKDPVNHYKPGPGVAPPGRNPGHVLEVDGYRIVYSVSHCGCGAVAHHMSIGFQDAPEAKFPGPNIVQFVGNAFGFVGPIQNWQVLLNHSERCVVAVQHLPN